MSRKRRPLRLAVMAGLLCVVLSAAWPVGAPSAMAQQNVAATEIAYDDGVPYKTVPQADVVCGLCLTYQGVRFGLGGVEVAAITSVRFYASVGASKTVYVHINDSNQNALLSAPTPVSVSSNGWYVVPIPEISVSGDFFVWIQNNSRTTMPFQDIRKDTNRSFIAEDPRGLHPLEVKVGDLMIRATVRAEIHVGKEDKYKYHVIQEAVNAADPFLAIVVHPGTYMENVVVDKDISIISSDGPSVTVVEAAAPGSDVFTVASDGVIIDGFTIRGGSTQAAGVLLREVARCFISNNTILDNNYGIYLSGPTQAGVSRENTILQNVVTSNTYGIWVGGQRNNICGNRIEDNTAISGAGIYLSDSSTDNWLRFNSFSSNTRSDDSVQVYYDGMFKAVDAINNWWGEPSGPHHPTGNPDGTGVGLGDMVEFSPWLGVAPLYVATGTADTAGYVLDARAEASTMVALSGSGRPIIWVARYSENPAGAFPTSSIGKWIDVCLSSTGDINEVGITVYYSPDELGSLEQGDLRLYWWNGSAWVPSSKQQVYKEEACIRATIAGDTSPGLSSLAGTPFAIGGVVAGGSGFQWWWIAAGILGLVVLVIVGRLVLRLLPQGEQYDYE